MDRFAERVVRTIQALPAYRRLARHLVGPLSIQVVSQEVLHRMLAQAKIVPGRVGSDWGEHTTNLVALRGGKPIGYVQLVHHPEDAPLYPGWWIFNLWVHPFWRGASIGNQLSRAALDLCEQHGVKSVNLLVDQENLPAIQLYRGLGFRYIPVSNPKWGETLILMERRS